jgi:hypothetical protein
MVSFRFYLVSVAAVFLALAVGITMGATVIDQVTVDQLHRSIREADAQARTDRATAKAATDQLGVAGKTVDDARASLVGGRLVGAPVVVVAVRGSDQGQSQIAGLRDVVTAAGADVEGTVWFTGKFKLDKPDDVAALSAALGLSPATPADQVRTTALSRLAAAWSEGGVTPLVGDLKSLGYLQYDQGTTKDPTLLPAPGTRFVVATPAQPDITDDLVAIPFTQQLARVFPYRVVAAEQGIPPSPGSKQQDVREVFVGPLRSNDLGVNTKLSTVDNIEDPWGQVAVVYALQNLASEKSGHYGIGAHRDAAFPPPPP